MDFQSIACSNDWKSFLLPCYIFLAETQRQLRKTMTSLRLCESHAIKYLSQL